MLEKFEKDRVKMWEVIRGLIPKPENMSSTLLTEDNDGLQTHTIKWEISLIKGFEIHVDGNLCGRVVGKNNSARITDLSSSKPHCVQIQVSLYPYQSRFLSARFQAIGLNGLKGEMSEKLRINSEVLN